VNRGLMTPDSSTTHGRPKVVCARHHTKAIDGVGPHGRQTMRSGCGSGPPPIAVVLVRSISQAKAACKGFKRVGRAENTWEQVGRLRTLVGGGVGIGPTRETWGWDAASGSSSLACPEPNSVGHGRRTGDTLAPHCACEYIKVSHGDVESSRIPHGPSDILHQICDNDNMAQRESVYMGENKLGLEHLEKGAGAEQIEHGDHALKTVADDRVELTQEDVRVPASIHRRDVLMDRTTGSEGRRTSASWSCSAGCTSCRSSTSRS